MSESTLNTIEELLRGIQDDIDDPETSYKLRSARQLVGVLQKRQQDLDDALDETIPDEDVLDNLAELGYLE